MTTIVLTEGARDAAPAWARVNSRLAAFGAITGGAMMTVGALLPWVTFMAGLQVVRGVAGINGQLLLAAGVAVMLAGSWQLATRSRPAITLAIGALGVVLTAASGVLSMRLLNARETLQANPMMVAELGPGLFLVLAGAAVVALTLFVPRR